jgi:hypothetical protein
MSTINTKNIVYQGTTGTTIYAVVLRLNDLSFFDNVDGKFRTSPSQGYLTSTEIVGMEGNFRFHTNSMQWDVGDYAIAFYTQAGGSPATSTDSLIETQGFTVIEDRMFGGPVAGR